MIKKKKITNCLTYDTDIQHKHKGAKYCNYKCYWKSTNLELKSKQQLSAKTGFIKYNEKNGVWNTGLTKSTNNTLKKMSESRRGG